jgi:hypothetical protein
MSEVGRGPDLGQETLGAYDGSQLRIQDLHGYFSIVLQVLGQVDSGHPAATDFTLDVIAVDQRSVEAFLKILIRSHGVHFRWQGTAGPISRPVS